MAGIRLFKGIGSTQTRAVNFSCQSGGGFCPNRPATSSTYKIVKTFALAERYEGTLKSAVIPRHGDGGIVTAVMTSRRTIGWGGSDSGVTGITPLTEIAPNRDRLKRVNGLGFSPPGSTLAANMGGAGAMRMFRAKNARTQSRAE